MIWVELSWSGHIWSESIKRICHCHWADLSWYDLSSAQLSWFKLSWADFIWSHMIWTELISSYLIWTDLIWSVLSRSHFIWAERILSDLSWPDLMLYELSHRVKDHFWHHKPAINLNLSALTHFKSRKMNLQWAYEISHTDFTLPLWGNGCIIPHLAVFLLNILYPRAYTRRAFPATSG